MKIYTKKGDDGTTGLLGGTRLAKHHLRIHSYGNVDELNAHIGLLRDVCPIDKYKKILLDIQQNLFTIGSHLATDPEHKIKMPLPQLSESDVTLLEYEMDEMESTLPEMRNFVLPGGHPAVSHCHISRCVCRRAERAVSALHDTSPVEPLLLAYLNRLSDFLFVLGRKFTQEFHVEEIAWKPRG